MILNLIILQVSIVNKLQLAMASCVAMEATLPFYQIVRQRSHMYLVTMIPLVHLFANQLYCSTFTSIGTLYTPRCLAFKLTYTDTYRICGTHLVIYIPIFALYEDTALSIVTGPAKTGHICTNQACKENGTVLGHCL